MALIHTVNFCAFISTGFNRDTSHVRQIRQQFDELVAVCSVNKIAREGNAKICGEEHYFIPE